LGIGSGFINTRIDAGKCGELEAVLNCSTACPSISLVKSSFGSMGTSSLRKLTSQWFVITTSVLHNYTGHYSSLSNKMDNSLLAVRDINHKYIVVKRSLRLCGQRFLAL